MRKLASALLLLTLTACGGAVAPTGDDSTGAASPSAAAVESSAPMASASPASNDAGLPSPAPSEAATSVGTIGGNAGAADEVERQALQALETQFNVNTGGLTLQNKEQVEWSDGSLGCASPDMMYMQVITPGYRVTLEHGGQRYVVHTDRGRRAVRCDTPKTGTSGNPPA